MDYDRIRAVKKDAQARLRSVPGVHAVGIGAKVVAGQPTDEPSIIVFVVQKKSSSEIPPEELVPAEIDGVKTDIVEAGIPQLNESLPDTNSYRSSGLEGGIQIAVGLVNFGGTLGCIGAMDEPNPRIVAITCQHVVAPQANLPSLSTLSVTVSPDGHTITFAGTSSATLQVAVTMTVTPTAGGASTFPRVQYVTVAGDTLATIASNLAGALHDPSVTAISAGAQLILRPGQGFQVVGTADVNRLFAVINDDLHLTITGTVDPGLLLLLRVVGRNSPTDPLKEADLFWVTSPTDTLAGIAAGIAADINAATLSGVPFTASANGPTVTLTPVLDAGGGFALSETHPAHAPQQAATLRAAISSDPAPGVNKKTITLSGRVSGDNYGIFTNVNGGGFAPTFGSFVGPAKDASLNDLASSIAIGLTNMKIPNMTFEAPGGARVVISGAEEVECLITSEVRVGQPDNNFPSGCSDCANSRIGKVIDARLDLDCALVALDPGMKYKNEVEGIGVVSGTHDVTDQEAHTQTFQVQKRGRTTGLHTNGVVTAIDVDGNIVDANGIFHRRYEGAMRIHSRTAATFSSGGDSGAAVLSLAHEVVGILFGSNGPDTVVTPIGKITEAMEVIVQTATAAGKVLTVPKPTGAHSPSFAPSPISGPAPALRVSLQDRLRETQNEFASTPAGRRFSTLIGFFAPEIRSLIDTNRRVAATWQRCGGPQLVQAILTVLHRHDQKLPEQIGGMPLKDCVAKIQEVLTRYGSPALSAALRIQAPRITRLGGLDYTQMLAALEASGTE